MFETPMLVRVKHRDCKFRTIILKLCVLHIYFWYFDWNCRFVKNLDMRIVMDFGDKQDRKQLCEISMSLQLHQG